MLDDLYREILRDHARAPHHWGTLQQADVTVTGESPVCGDTITLQLCFSGGKVAQVGFHGSGCTISLASASILTDMIMDRAVETLPKLIDAAEELLRGTASPDNSLGDLAALSGVARYPTRVRCALLAWKALRRALDDYTGMQTIA